MQKAKLVKPVSAGMEGEFGKAGTEGFILRKDDEHVGFMARMCGIEALYAFALPKESLTDAEIKTAEWLFDDESGSFYGEMDAIIKEAPEGYVVTTVDNTEIELID